MKNNLFILLSFVCICRSANAQFDNIWMLGSWNGPGYVKPALSFYNNTVDTFSLLRDMPFNYTNAGICDSAGTLLFYTNGIYIANKNHDTLLNGSNFNPGWGTNKNYGYGLFVTQGAIILPVPLHKEKYMLFHVSYDSFYYQVYFNYKPFRLAYSIVDMTLDSGLGGVVPGLKNITIINDTLTSGRLTATRHANGRDWWVVMHRLWFNSNTWYKLLVTPDSIITYTQQIGTMSNNDYFGQGIFSPDGSSYACAGPNYNYVSVFDFDRCTGMLSNEDTFTIPSPYITVGCSFSPNSRFLYVNNQVEIFQFDTWNLPLKNTFQKVADWDSTGCPSATYFFLNQLAPDGKIYISPWNSCNQLTVIDSPDSAGTSCHVLQNTFFIPNWNISVPNFPNYYLGPLIGSPCDSLGLGEEEFNQRDFMLKIYPNPNDGQFTVNYRLPGRGGGYEGKLEVFTLLGEKIYSLRLPPWSSMQNLNLQHLPVGLYIVKISCNGYTGYDKMIKQ